MCHNAHQNALKKLLRTHLKSLCEWFWSIEQLTLPFYTLSGNPWVFPMTSSLCHITSWWSSSHFDELTNQRFSRQNTPMHKCMSLKLSRHFLIVHPDFEEATSFMLHLPHTLVKFGLVYHALFCLRIHSKHASVFLPSCTFYPLAHLYLTSSVLLFRWQIGHSKMRWKYLRRKVVSTSRCCEAM